jgi:hypothetical protein
VCVSAISGFTASIRGPWVAWATLAMQQVKLLEKRLVDANQADFVESVRKITNGTAEPEPTQTTLGNVISGELDLISWCRLYSILFLSERILPGPRSSDDFLS